MAIDKNSLSFGRYLKTTRVKKGISLEQVSRETRVGMETLLLMEKEDHEGLPAEVFVKGFLRAYAKAIGADEDVAVQRYLLNRNAIQETARLEADSIESSRSIWPRFVISLGAIFCMITLSIFGASFYEERLAGEGSIHYKTEGEKRDDTTIKDLRAPGAVRKPIESIPEKLLLKVVTIEDTRITVTIDDHKPKAYNLHPGDRIELEASSGFNLHIGNAGGVRLILNEKDLAVPGQRGQAVTVRVP